MQENYYAYLNDILCRKDLEMLIVNKEGITCERLEPCNDIGFLKVSGMTSFWKRDEIDISSLLGDILSSCNRYNLPFIYAIIGDIKGINIYIGSLKVLIEKIKASYQAGYPGLDISIEENNPLLKCSCSNGGVFTGIPTNKNAADKKSLQNFQIENICRGMLGKNFTYIVVARGIDSTKTSLAHEHLLNSMAEIYEDIEQSVQTGSQKNLQVKKKNFQGKNYFDNLERLEKLLMNGVSRGMWRVNGYYASDNQFDAEKLANIIKASFLGSESLPDCFRIIKYKRIGDIISNNNKLFMISDLYEDCEEHPLGTWTQDDYQIQMYKYKYQTILNSDQLAILCQLPKKEFPGFYIDEYVEFDVADRNYSNLKNPVIIGDICTAARVTDRFVNNSYCIEKNDFTRHALIIGITGGGKTNTSKSILNTLWNKENIPFMVIESAKREYWELRNIHGFEKLLVFTLGSEAASTSVKYRINPFETISGISLQTHIDYLLSTFKAAFELYPPMPYVLEQAVYEVYKDRGWDIVENKNLYGFTEYPTLSDLYNKIDVVVDSLGYHQEIQSNVKAALQARISSLMIGGKGAMLNTHKSVPISELLTRPVVMELEDIGDDETKSFVIGILLVQLYEYRKSQMSKGVKQLSHILMIEEAHRLLKNVTDSGESGNSRAKSVEFFCNLLAEIRTFGQGIIVADQIPTKIASDTIKNTNLKIVHRTVALEDREVMGRAMNMTPEQIEYLSSLRRGFAAVYAEGDSKPKCVLLPLVKSQYSYDRDEVISSVQKQMQTMIAGYDKEIKHHVGCMYCEHRCKYYERISKLIEKIYDLTSVNNMINEDDDTQAAVNEFMETSGILNMNLSNLFEKICLLGYVLQRNNSLTDGQIQKLISGYLENTLK